MLGAANRQSYSCITVDGDTSTSDTVLAFATGKAGNAPLTSVDDPGAGAFQAALTDLCVDLAQQVVRDGEGASKFITVDVIGAESDASAHRIAITLAHSPLVTKAIAGASENRAREGLGAGTAGAGTRAGTGRSS